MHLIISVAIVIPVAFVYGFFPEILYGIAVTNVDEQNTLKSLMGVYLGFSYLWVLGIFKPAYLKVALVSNMVFMLGLGFGRCTSLILDGLPSRLFTLGIVGEFILGFYGLSLLYNEKK